MAPAPSGAPLARFIPETKTNVAPFCCQMCTFFETPGQGPRPVITSAVTNRTFLVKCRLVRAKRSLSRHYKTASTENCHLASTKHLLLTMLEFRFAKCRGICIFEMCIENVTNLVSQLRGSSHLAGGCILGCPVASQIPKPMVAAKKPERTKARTRVTTATLRPFHH